MVQVSRPALVFGGLVLVVLGFGAGWLAGPIQVQLNEPERPRSVSVPDTQLAPTQMPLF